MAVYVTRAFGRHDGAVMIVYRMTCAATQKHRKHLWFERGPLDCASSKTL